MWVTRMLVLGALALPVTIAHADGRNTEQQAKKQKTDEKAKKGALEEKKDPAKDLALQKENLKKLRINSAEDKKVGNRAAAWAADRDAHHAEKLIKKDEKLLEQGKRSK